MDPYQNYTLGKGTGAPAQPRNMRRTHLPQGTPPNNYLQSATRPQATCADFSTTQQYAQQSLYQQQQHAQSAQEIRQIQAARAQTDLPTQAQPQRAGGMSTQMWPEAQNTPAARASASPAQGQMSMQMPEQYMQMMGLAPCQMSPQQAPNMAAMRPTYSPPHPDTSSPSKIDPQLLLHQSYANQPGYLPGSNTSFDFDGFGDMTQSVSPSARGTNSIRQIATPQVSGRQQNLPGGTANQASRGMPAQVAQNTPVTGQRRPNPNVEAGATTPRKRQIIDPASMRPQRQDSGVSQLIQSLQATQPRGGSSMTPASSSPYTTPATVPSLGYEQLFSRGNAQFPQATPSTSRQIRTPAPANRVAQAGPMPVPTRKDSQATRAPTIKPAVKSSGVAQASSAAYAPPGTPQPVPQSVDHKSRQQAYEQARQRQRLQLEAQTEKARQGKEEKLKKAEEERRLNKELAEAALREKELENERREQQRLWEEQQAETARRSKRKAELKKDPNVNFHSLWEYLEYFPPKRGERAEPYMTTLVANRQMPEDEDSELARAIVWAKKNWHLYRRWPKDVEECAEAYDKDKAKEEKDQPAASKKGKQPSRS